MRYLPIALVLLLASPARAEIAVSRLDASSVADRRDLVAAASHPAAEAVALAASDSPALSVLVSCALPAGVEIDVLGVTYLGEHGLAPGWRRRPMTSADRRLVTACLLARLSGRQVAVPISMRGPRLSTDDEERAIFGLEEGAFFGDALADGGEVFACTGVDDASSRDRVCASPSPSGRTSCGLVWVGTCVDVCRRRAGRYDWCRSSTGVTSAVVTVFLQ